MTVYLRTGEGSAVSFPWWFYLLVVLPLQLLFLTAKAMVVLLAVTAVGTFLVAGWVWRRSAAALGEPHGSSAP